MNYNRLYDMIIERAMSRAKTEKLEFCEIHHIIPKCMGGTDEKSNLVALSLREHFLAHWLLHKIHPTSAKLLYAWNSFCMNNGSRTATSHLYEYARRKFVKAMKELKYTNPDSHQRKIESVIGKVWMNNGVQSVRVA